MDYINYKALVSAKQGTLGGPKLSVNIDDQPWSSDNREPTVTSLNNYFGKHILKLKLRFGATFRHVNMAEKVIQFGVA